MSQRKPTLADVARYAQVSTATISRVLNEPDAVATETRVRVQTAIDQLGYTPNFAGRALASRRSNTVGVVIPSLANAMFSNGLYAFQDTLSETGKTILLANSDYDPEQEFHQIQSLVTHGAEALMLIGAERPKKTLDFIRLRGIPYVLSWCFGDDSQLYAGFDNRDAARQMALHVLEMGHREIAMIAGISVGNDRARGRIDGVKDAVAQFGKGARLLAVEEVPYLLDDAYDGFRRLWSCHRPTALIGGSDVLAAGAMNAAKAMGLRIPSDLSITGFDDIGLASVADPALTTVHVPQRKMGRKAAGLLLDMLDGKTNLHSVKIETHIVNRGSLSSPKEI